jgi:predicted RNase H-like nuclease (RuvC/YqgF family)
MSSSQSSPLNKSSLTDKDWYAIACKIRKQNQEFKEKTAKLETIIEEQKTQIKVQVIKNQDQNNLIEEQHQKIEALDLKITHYEEKIAQKDQQYQKQKSIFDDVNSELKKTQQLAAGLERECSLLQDKYNEIQHQLKQKEKENKELQIRLQRQQRYNTQYKAALDQYLTVSSATSHDVGSLGIESWSKDQPNNLTQINLFSEDEKINQENSEVILNNLELKADQDIVNNSSKNSDNSQLLNNNEKSSVSSILLENNLSLPPLNKSEKKDNDLEVKTLDNFKNGEKKARQSFLKLPKFGK